MKILRLARKTGGFYSLVNNGGFLPHDTFDYVYGHGASYLTHGE